MTHVMCVIAIVHPMTEETQNRFATGGAPFRRYRAWAACHELTLTVFQASNAWGEDPWLRSQVRLTALRAPSQVARGASSFSTREFRRCLGRALTALDRLACLIELGAELQWIPATDKAKIEVLRDHAWHLTAGLDRALKRGPKRKRPKNITIVPGASG
jgi:hypothetical protein